MRGITAAAWEQRRNRTLDAQLPLLATLSGSDAHVTAVPHTCVLPQPLSSPDGRPDRPENRQWRFDLRTLEACDAPHERGDDTLEVDLADIDFAARPAVFAQSDIFCKHAAHALERSGLRPM